MGFWNFVFGIVALSNVIFIYPVWLTTLNFPTPGVPFELVIISTVLMLITGIMAFRKD
jgi:hypothetical protein